MEFVELLRLKVSEVGNKSCRLIFDNSIEEFAIEAQIGPNFVVELIKKRSYIRFLSSTLQSSESFLGSQVKKIYGILQTSCFESSPETGSKLDLGVASFFLLLLLRLLHPLRPLRLAHLESRETSILSSRVNGRIGITAILPRELVRRDFQAWRLQLETASGHLKRCERSERSLTAEKASNSLTFPL